jgi:hypothetical protein
MNTQHTPGPWAIYRGTPQTYADIYAANWHGLAKVVVRLDGKGKDNAKGLANARLIAAAPDLLAASVRSLAIIEDFETSFKVTLKEGNLLRAAIAKAKGN